MLPMSLDDSYGSDAGYKGASVELILALNDSVQSPRDQKFIASEDASGWVPVTPARPARMVTALSGITSIITPPIRAPPQIS